MVLIDNRWRHCVLGVVGLTMILQLEPPGDYHLRHLHGKHHENNNGSSIFPFSNHNQQTSLTNNWTLPIQSHLIIWHFWIIKHI